MGAHPQLHLGRRSVVAALGACMAAATLPTARAETGRRIEWRDVTLFDGSVVRAADLRAQHVVVEVWATWCPFCKKQNRHLQALHEKAGGKGLTVLTFAIDKDVQLIRDYQRRNKYTFAAAQYTPQVERWFGRRRSLPELYVVDRGGKVVVEELGEMFPEDVAALARFANGG
jgi:thiol-disulfide isomerase/thioredoxin